MIVYSAYLYRFDSATCASRFSAVRGTIYNALYSIMAHFGQRYGGVSGAYLVKVGLCVLAEGTLYQEMHR